MTSKDYFAILELPPFASPDEIKKAYRKLAMIYHPDKTGDDPYAAARFRDIREAYEVLCNPVQRERYFEQRWYERAMGSKMAGTEPLTPHRILRQCLELNRYVYYQDRFRMDSEKLLRNIRLLTAQEYLEAMEHFGETETNRQILISLLDTCRRLPFRYVKQLLPVLEKITGNDKSSLESIDKFYQSMRKEHRWEKSKGWVALALAALLLGIIYLMSRPKS